MTTPSDPAQDTSTDAVKMHAGEVSTSPELVRRLIVAQFPQWRDLPIRAVPSGGTDNAIYRLGHDMAVRMPRIAWAVGQVQKEQEWLPRLAPYLPLPIPMPLALGRPGEDYPWHWSVYRWLEGNNATAKRLADPCRAARELSHFIRALQKIDTTGGPAAGEHNSGRGVPLVLRDTTVQEAIAALKDTHETIDTHAAASAWEDALNAPVWQNAPVWVHGDLQQGNLLVERGQLSAVIDFGGLGIGDPACDLIVAWNLFAGRSRDVFRAELGVDEATWARGRGWALSVGLIALPYYLPMSPAMVRYARHIITEVIADFERGT
ncbi:MAG: aminoglycoside phosphotransferase family protein [Armatimonadota bacterium]